MGEIRKKEMGVKKHLYFVKCSILKLQLHHISPPYSPYLPYFPNI